MRRTILLSGDAVEEAGIASATVTPGMLVEYGGGADYRPHDTAGGAAAALFARQRHEDKGAGIDDDIAAGGEVAVLRAAKGSKINAITDDTIAKGDFVESAGGGKVRPFDSGIRIGYAADDSVLPAEGNGRVPIIVI